MCPPPAILRFWPEAPRSTASCLRPGQQSQGWMDRAFRARGGEEEVGAGTAVGSPETFLE